MMIVVVMMMLILMIIMVIMIDGGGDLKDCKCDDHLFTETIFKYQHPHCGIYDRLLNQIPILKSIVIFTSYE